MKPVEAPKPLVVDRPAAAAMLGISEWSLDKLIADGEIPAVKYPSSKRRGRESRRVLIAISDLHEFVAKCRGVK